MEWIGNVGKVGTEQINMLVSRKVLADRCRSQKKIESEELPEGKTYSVECLMEAESSRMAWPEEADRALIPDMVGGLSAGREFCIGGSEEEKEATGAADTTLNNHGE